MSESRYALVESRTTGTFHIARDKEPVQLTLLDDGGYQRAETFTLCARDTAVSVWVWRRDLPLALVECGLCRQRARKYKLFGASDAE